MLTLLDDVKVTCFSQLYLCLASGRHMPVSEGMFLQLQ